MLLWHKLGLSIRYWLILNPTPSTGEGVFVLNSGYWGFQKKKLLTTCFSL